MRVLWCRKLSKASREILRECLAEISAAEDAKLEQEMLGVEPHVFSARHEAAMAEIMRVQKRKTHCYSFVRYAAAAIVTLAVVTGLICIGNEDLQASKPAAGILAWLDEFFVVGDKFNEEEEALFTEAQIGYLPEDFEKVFEEVVHSSVHYKYVNAEGKYISLEVYRNSANLGVDNEEVEFMVGINDAGFEYRFFHNDEAGYIALSWTDTQNIFYYIQSSLADKAELMKMMDSISY